MKKKILSIVLCLALLGSALPTILSSTPALAADPTTSVHVIKYAADGTTILDETTLTYTEMETGLPVQGDGTTLYYHQGPTFDDGNLWDPDETMNLKDKGAMKGTDIKDLCDLVGGASAGSTIRVKCIEDGFNKSYAYEDVYAPEPAQGKMVLCWFKDGEYVPDFADGMQVNFLAETTNAAGQYVFGNQDMHDYMAEEYWHYFGIYPSTNGHSVKWVEEIAIFSSAPPQWELTLEGADTYVMSQSEFEGSIGPTHHPAATWVDGTDTWSGLPLWLLVGWVDDDVQHGPGAFNAALATDGYDVKVIATDGYSKTFASADVARNDDMIIANMLNGLPLPEDKYPLKLVGPDLTSGQKVSQIATIELVGLPEGANASLSATATVSILTVGISLDMDSIDYGEVMPGDSSAIETVGITNIGTVEVDTTLEVDGADGTAQSFYELSLYVDGVLYDLATVIAQIPTSQSEDVDTQLQVPETWNEGAGIQQATFIFWAEAS